MEKIIRKKKNEFMSDERRLEVYRQEVKLRMKIRKYQEKREIELYGRILQKRSGPIRREDAMFGH